MSKTKRITYVESELPDPSFFPKRASWGVDVLTRIIQAEKGSSDRLAMDCVIRRYPHQYARPHTNHRTEQEI